MLPKDTKAGKGNAEQEGGRRSILKEEMRIQRCKGIMKAKGD